MTRGSSHDVMTDVAATPLDELSEVLRAGEQDALRAVALLACAIEEPDINCCDAEGLRAALTLVVSVRTDLKTVRNALESAGVIAAAAKESA